MKKKYPVILNDTERDELKRLIAAGTAPARKLTYARILLKADQGPEGPGCVDDAVAKAVEVSQPTVCRVRKQCVEEGEANNSIAHPGADTKVCTISPASVLPNLSEAVTRRSGCFSMLQTTWSRGLSSTASSLASR